MFVVVHVASGVEMSFSSIEAMAEAEAKKLGAGYAVAVKGGYAAKIEKAAEVAKSVYAKFKIPGMPESWCAGECFA